jgi:hypothetical protein
MEELTKNPEPLSTSPLLDKREGEVSIGLAGKKDDDASSVVQA